MDIVMWEVGIHGSSVLHGHEPVVLARHHLVELRTVRWSATVEWSELDLLLNGRGV